ncbi:hypothetical protein MTO96_018840 [Rhipicephalus appendiculatus]
MAWLSDKKNAKAVRVLSPAPQADDGRIEALWLELRRAIDEIQEKQSTGQRFDDLYRAAYVMVAQNEGERLYQGLREAVTEHLANKASMRMIGDIAKYLDIVYVPKKNVDSVGKAGVLLFRDEVARYDDVRERLRETMLGLPWDSARGRSTRKTSKAFFLAETAQFYASRGQHYIATKDAFEYVAQVEQHVNEESERAKHCLDDSTVVPVVQMVQNELVGKHVKAIVDMEDSGVEHMLRNQMNDDLARLFRFLKCVQGGVKTFLDCVSKHLRNLGRSITNEHGDSGSLIPQVMDLRNRFDYLVEHCFEKDEAAKQAIAADFEYILGLTNKSPEYLAAFVDDMMRRGIKHMTKQETDQLLDKIMGIFRPLQDKDLFERHYKQRLAKRLLLNKSASEEAEKTMVAKLRKECGCLFTSKMEAMFKDMHISSNMMKEFKDAISSSRMDLGGIDINVRILTTGFWPLAAAEQLSNIPAGPWSVFQTFRRFYLAKHSGRQLNLQPHLGWADMSAVFYGTGERAINVPGGDDIVRRASSADLHHPSVDVPDRQTSPETSLVRALHSLCMSKASEPVLTKTPASNEVGNGDVFAVNESFTSGLQKVKLESTSGSKTSATKCSQPAINLDEDRRYALEAAIVRVMKARLKMSHDDLFAEVTAVLQGIYTPSATAFKTRVDALVERVYLERDADNEDVYNYVP